MAKIEVPVPLNTYNIELANDVRGIDVIEAVSFELSNSGALVFHDRDGNVKAFNAEKWIHVWKI